MAAEVGPSREVGVVVLAAGLEEVGMVGHEHGGDTRLGQFGGDGVLPDFDGSPRLPQEVECSTENVMARRDARQRAGVVGGEAQGPPGQPVDVGCVELAGTVRAEQVAVEAVEENDHH